MWKDRHGVSTIEYLVIVILLAAVLWPVIQNVYTRLVDSVSNTSLTVGQ